jgi:hypothetical protein
MHNSRVALGILLVVCGYAFLDCLASRNSNRIPKDAENDRSYLNLLPVHDHEERLRPLAESEGKDRFDLKALEGMPQAYRDLLSTYLYEMAHSLSVKPLTRMKYYQKQHRWPAGAEDFPDHTDPTFDKAVALSILLLPRPAVVRRWSESTVARVQGWRSEADVTSRRGTVYGRSVVFNPGEHSQNPAILPTDPIGAPRESQYQHYPGQGSRYFLALGKVVATPEYEWNSSELPVDVTACLRIGELGEAKLCGEIITVPPHVDNHRLHWVTIRYNSDVRRYLGYSILDGFGGRRTDRGPGNVTRDRLSPYMRPLLCKQYQPKINQHDELLVPTPLPWAPNWSEKLKTHRGVAHEEWCLDEWFPAQKDACWVVREAEDSKPLQESFLLMPASEKSDRPLFLIALFAETEPRRLVTELAALHNVSPDPVLNSPETMERLESLYQKVRDFPLDK